MISSREKLLNFLKKECEPNGYFVFSIQELSTQTEGNPSNKETVNAVIKLAEQGYISVKYDDGKRICLKVLDKAYEDKKDTSIQDVKDLSNKYFRYGFLGSLSGGLTIATIMLLLKIAGVT